MESYGNSLRSCAGCSAHIITNDARSKDVFCKRCAAKLPTPEAWADGVGAGDLVYLQPYAAFPGLSFSRYLVTARAVDTLTVHVLGCPDRTMEVDIRHTAQRDMTPRH